MKKLSTMSLTEINEEMKRIDNECEVKTLRAHKSKRFMGLLNEKAKKLNLNTLANRG